MIPALEKVIGGSNFEYGADLADHRIPNDKRILFDAITPSILQKLVQFFGKNRFCCSSSQSPSDFPLETSANGNDLVIPALQDDADAARMFASLSGDARQDIESVLPCEERLSWLEACDVLL